MIFAIKNQYAHFLCETSVKRQLSFFSYYEFTLIQYSNISIKSGVLLSLLNVEDSTLYQWASLISKDLILDIVNDMS